MIENFFELNVEMDNFNYIEVKKNMAVIMVCVILF